MALKGFQKGNTFGVPFQSQEYSKNASKQKLIKIARAKELLRQGLSKAEAMRVMVEEGLSNRSIKSTAGPATFMKQAADELIAEGVKITPGTKTIGDGFKKRSRDRRYKATQAKSNKGMEIKMAVPKELKSNLQLSHAGGKYSPVGLHNLMYVDGRKNLKMVKPFEDKIFAEMEKFNKVYEDVDAPNNIKRLAALEYAKSDRSLRKKYPEYAKLKTRLSFKNTAFAPGFTVKEKLLDPSMAISNEPGTLIKGITPSSKKGKEILKFSKENLEQTIKRYNNEPKNSPFRKKMDKRINCADGCFVKVARKNPEKILTKLNKNTDELKAIFATPEVTNIKAPLVNSFSGQIRPELPSVKYNNITGLMVNTANGEKATAADIKKFEVENPLKTVAGTEDAYKPIAKGMLKTVGAALTKVGAPLPTALLDGYFISKQVQEDRPAAEIAADPLNWLGLALMSPATKAATRLGGGVALRGILTLGLAAPAIAATSTVAGIALVGTTAYQAYKEYDRFQNEKGLIYNYFNPEAKAV